MNLKSKASQLLTEERSQSEKQSEETLGGKGGENKRTLEEGVGRLPCRKKEDKTKTRNIKRAYEGEGEKEGVKEKERGTKK